MVLVMLACISPWVRNRAITLRTKALRLIKLPERIGCLLFRSVRISPIKQIEGLTHTKALAEVVFNDQLLIRGIRVVEGENGLYISYPFQFHPTTGEDGQPRSTVFPITKVLRDHVEAVVLEKYQDTINNEKVTNK